MWTVLFRGLCVARELFHNDPSAETLMTVRVGCPLESPYQNSSPAVNRQKQTGLERGVLSDSSSSQQKQNNMASVPRLVTVIFLLLAFLKST